MEHVTPQMREQMKLYAEHLASQFPDLNAPRSDQTEAVWPRVQTEAQRIVEKHMPEPVEIATLRRKQKIKLGLTWALSTLTGIVLFVTISENNRDVLAVLAGCAIGTHFIIRFTEPPFDTLLRHAQSASATQLVKTGIHEFHANILNRQAGERKNN